MPILFWQFEFHEQSVPHINGYAIFSSWCEFGQCFADAYSLLVKVLIHRSDNLHFTDIAILINNKLHNDFPLNVVAGGHGRVMDVRLDVFHQSLISSWKFGHLYTIALEEDTVYTDLITGTMITDVASMIGNNTISIYTYFVPARDRLF